MTDGEKLVWAAAFADAMGRDFDGAESASHAEDVVLALRHLVEIESMLSTGPHYLESDYCKQAKEMIAK